jgi:hypothetical protein
MSAQEAVSLVVYRSVFDLYPNKESPMFKSLCLSIVLLTITSTVSLEAQYVRPSHVDIETWKEVEPHFVPYNHPIRKSLDSIFHQKKRVLLSKKSMKKAGFTNYEPEKTTRILVTRHPKLPGYIFKTHLDAQKARKNLPEQHFWLLRIEGAKTIKNLIAEKGWQNTFTVPKKMIYPLPAHPAPPSAFQRINFILVEEDMDILGAKENNQMWGSGAVDKELLDKLYFITETLGLNDCAKPDNAPFSRDGTIAFIDTQTHENWPVFYKKLTPFLSPEMRTYWKSLTKRSRKS